MTHVEQNQSNSMVPFLIDRDATRLCEIRPPFLLDTIQRLMVPIFTESNKLDEFYPLLINLSSIYFMDDS